MTFVIRTLTVLCLGLQLTACARLFVPADFAAHAPPAPRAPAREVVDMTPRPEADVISLAEVSPLLRPRSRGGPVARAGVLAGDKAPASSEAPDNDMDARMERLLARQEADSRQASALVCRGCLGAFRPPSYAAAPRPLTGEEQAVARTGAVPDRARGSAPREPVPAIEADLGKPMDPAGLDAGS